MKRALIVFAVLLVAGWCAVRVAFEAAGRDCAPPDVSDLVADRPVIAPHENAYTYFVAATNALCWHADSADIIKDYLDGKPVDPAALSGLLASNAAAVELVRRGASCRRCIAPELTGFDAPLLPITAWRRAALLLAAQSRCARSAGRYGEATANCVALLRFANAVEQDAQSLIHYLVGVSLLDIALKQARELARDEGASAKERGVLADALAELAPAATGLIQASKGEYKVAAITADRICEGRSPLDGADMTGQSLAARLLKRKLTPGYIFQPNATKRYFAAIYRGVIDDAPRPFAEMKRQGEGELVVRREWRWSEALRPNAVGRLLGAALSPALGDVLAARCKADCGVSATRVIVACHRYRERLGQFPSSLSELVPGYLPCVPLDPYDGRPLRYVAAKGIVYAVGADLADAGGSTNSVLRAGSAAPAVRMREAEDRVYDL